MSWVDHAFTVPTDAVFSKNLHVFGNTRLDGPVSIRGIIQATGMMVGPLSLEQHLLYAIEYQGKTLREYFQQILTLPPAPLPNVAPLFTYPGITTSAFCTSIATHYFANTPNHTKLPEMLVPWLSLQTEYLARVMEKRQTACMGLLVWTLPETQSLIDGQDGVIRQQLDKKIDIPGAQGEEVARVLIGAYGSLRCVIESFICGGDESYNKIYMSKLIGVLCAMRNDFPESIQIDKEVTMT